MIEGLKPYAAYKESGTCVAVYVSELDEDGQVDFKGKAKAFINC